MYYIFVTISTVGYGDVVPVTVLGRIFAIMSIIGGVGIFVAIFFSITQI